MRRIWHITLKVTRIAIGVLLLLAGLTGLILPILPGWLLIIPGLLILAKDIPMIRWLLCQSLTSRPANWLETRFPRIQRPLHNLRQRLRSPRQPTCP